MTYGDGVSDVDISKLIQHHGDNGKKATVTAVRQPSRFGALDLNNDSVREIREKSLGDGNWINSGFFVLEPSIFDEIEGDRTSWEKEPLSNLTQQDQLCAYRHEGFWQPMDTLREKDELQSLWDSGSPPWKVW